MFSIKKGARLPVMTISTTEDLTGASGLGLRWRLLGGGPRVISAGTPTLVSSGASGSVVEYQFQTGETDTEGTYEVEITATIAGALIIVPEAGFGQFKVGDTIE